MNTITCGCGRTISVRDELAGRPVKCIYCGAIVHPPAPAPAAPPPPAKIRCPFCASEIDAGLTACPFCNENLARHAAGKVAPGASMRRCPTCGESINARDATCPYCRFGTNRAAAPAQAAGPGVPWEDDAGRSGFFSRWWRTWAASQFQADPFFAGMRWKGGIKAPLTFILGWLGQLIGLASLCGIPFIFLLMASAAQSSRSSAAMSGPVILIAALAYVAFAVIATIVGSFIMAGINHVCALMLGGSGSYEASYRATAYSYGAAVWGLIPYIGVIPYIVFHFIALTHALAYAHKISKTRGFFAAAIPFMVCCGGLIAFYAVVFAAAMSGGRMR